MLLFQLLRLPKKMVMTPQADEVSSLRPLRRSKRRHLKVRYDGSR